MITDKIRHVFIDCNLYRPNTHTHQKTLLLAILEHIAID